MGEPVYAQPGAAVRLDWGLSGAAELARVCAALVIVDVLSFTTSVTVAVERGSRVHPFPWGEQPEEYARRIGATVASGRRSGTPEQPWSLSPAALLRAPAVPDLVLPSPNGSAIAAASAGTGIPVVAGCARNASTVALWLLAHGYSTVDRPVGVVAAGERWPDGSLRPCVEDLLGAALVLEGLALDGLSGAGGLSVEAAVGLAALAALPDVPAAIRGCVSGRELIERGFPEDVEVAADVGASTAVPILQAGAFVSG